MALDVIVKISLSKPVGNLGPWYPLIYVIDSTAETDTYGEYSGLDELAEAGYAESTDAYKAANLMLMQDENGRPGKFAVLKQKTFSVETFGKYKSKGWRQLVLAGANADFANIAAYIETTDKMLFVSTNETTTTAGKLDRTFVVYHDKETNIAAAVVGATAGYEAGSFTYKNIILKGVEPVEMTDTEIENLHKAGVITILEKAGDIVTSEGIVSSGEYADIIDSKDYIIQNIAYGTQKVFNTNKKVAYTDAGIGLLEGATISVLKKAFNNDMIATDEDGIALYSTQFALRSQTTEEDRASRKYPYGKFSFELAGAIHTATVNGEITV
jgi:hypothetical protein